MISKLYIRRIAMKCIVCGKSIQEGIIVNSRFICLKCEERMVNSNIDTDFYNYFIDVLKKSRINKLDTKGESINCQNRL